MFKKNLMTIFVLTAFIASWGQGEQVELDVIIRDFQVTEIGFEEFDSQKSGSDRQCNGNEAAKGMVQTLLSYNKDCPKEDVVGKATDPDHIRYRYCAYPTPNPNATRKCYGENLQRWFTNGDHTKHVNEVMTLTLKDGLYEIVYDSTTRTDWNGYGATAGYFPLDKYDNPNDRAYSPGKTFGMQSLAQWCPNRTTTGNCGAWWAQGGPKEPSAAKRAADSVSSLKKDLHNFGFTVAGSAQFRYDICSPEDKSKNKCDRFAFTGDDDMWVFIDGELAIDLGGIHSAVSGSFTIDSIATARGWSDGSMHSINFFYAERQTMASNLRLRFALSGLSEPRFGAPRIVKAVTTLGSNGSPSETSIWVNTKLDLESINDIKNSGNFPIIVKRSDNSVIGYKLVEIKGGDADGSNGYIYTITGSLCEDKNDTQCTLAIGSGDSLSFNVKSLEADFRDTKNVTLPDNSNLHVKNSTKTAEATKVSWAPNTTRMAPIDFKPIVSDKNPIKPEFIQEWFSGSPTDGACVACGQLPNSNKFPSIDQIWDPEAIGSDGKKGAFVSPTTNTTVHGFGKTGTPIPPQRAGELILTSFPNANPGSQVHTSKGTYDYKTWFENDSLNSRLGLPPEADPGRPYGVADPKQQASDGGYQFVKNGFPNESSVGGIGRVAPTRCVVADSSRTGEKRVNCLNFSLLAKQPFQISVIIYDQLGNFVTQYRETVTEREFRSVVQGPNYVDAEKNEVAKLVKNATKDCVAPTSSNFGKPDVLTINGLVKVNVNIYPFSKDGRRFGNGVYIAKIDRVDLPYDGCVNNEGMPMLVHEDYKRYHAEQRFGWMRKVPKK